MVGLKLTIYKSGTSFSSTQMNYLLAPLRQQEKWQKTLAKAVKDPAELLELLELPTSLLPEAIAASKQFPLKVTRCYINRIAPGDSEDPLLLQVLPLHQELDLQPGFVTDPVADLASTVVPGLLHKYFGRVLLTVTGACAIHCRYCFRRHFPYDENNPAADNWSQAISYISDDPSITEVILSGGDPLMLNDQRLAALCMQLSQISHLKRIRIHTRLPIIAPQRVTNTLLDWISGSTLKIIIVIHSNHKNEIDSEVGAALVSLRATGVTVLNQSVLLRKINDNSDTLCELSTRLFDYGVLPYYLHILDKVKGASHFEVPHDSAIKIINAMRTKLPGYLVPRLAWEEPGKPNKIIIQ